VLGLAIPVVVAGTGYGPYLAARSDLPDRVANRFDSSGVATGSMALSTFLVLVSAFMVGGIGVTVALALRRHPITDGIGPILAFGGGFVGQVGATIVLWVSLTQRSLGRWWEAEGPGLEVVALALLPLLVGAVAARAATALPAVASSTGRQEVEALDLAPGEHAVWTRTLQVRWISRTGLAATLVTVIVAAFTEWWVAIPGVLGGLAMVALSVIRVTADRAGLQVRYGIGPWPRTASSRPSGSGRRRWSTSIPVGGVAGGTGAASP
jgi:hypothetical protein